MKHYGGHNRLTTTVLLAMFIVFITTQSIIVTATGLPDTLADSFDFSNLSDQPLLRSVQQQTNNNGTKVIIDDLDFTFRLPYCPTSERPTAPIVQTPSTFSFFLLISLSSLLFASIVFSSFNSVFLPHIRKRIRTSAISNTLWIIYFVIVSLRSVVNAVHFGKPTSLRKDNRFLFGMTVCGMFLHALSALFLTLSLNYQRKHRSGFSVNSTNALLNQHQQKIASEREEEKIGSTFKRRTAYITDIIFKLGSVIISFEAWAVFCFFFSIISIILRISNMNAVGELAAFYKWFELAVLLFQRVPIVIICIMIICTGITSICTKKPTGGGPGIPVRILVLAALLFNIPNDIPLSYWNYFLFVRIDSVPSCVFYFANIFDAILVMFLISLVLWLCVMVIEFRRYRKETVEAALADSVENFE